MKEVSEQEWEGIISEERFNSISTTLNEIASTLSEDNDREITLAIQNQGLILENILTTLKSNPETDQEAILTELKNIDKSILDLKITLNKKKKWEFKIERDNQSYYITSVTAIQTN